MGGTSLDTVLVPRAPSATAKDSAIEHNTLSIDRARAESSRVEITSETAEGRDRMDIGVSLSKCLSPVSRPECVSITRLRARRDTLRGNSIAVPWLRYLYEMRTPIRVRRPTHPRTRRTSCARHLYSEYVTFRVSAFPEILFRRPHLPTNRLSRLSNSAGGISTHPTPRTLKMRRASGVRAKMYASVHDEHGTFPARSPSRCLGLSHRESRAARLRRPPATSAAIVGPNYAR